MLPGWDIYGSPYTWPQVLPYYCRISPSNSVHFEKKNQSWPKQNSFMNHKSTLIQTSNQGLERQFSCLATLPENLGSILSTYLVARNLL